MGTDLPHALLAELADKYVKDNDVVAVGTSPASIELLKTLALMCEQKKIGVSLVPTSKAIAVIAGQLKIPLADINELEIDVAFEFATQIDQNFNFIKHDSASLVRDKMIAQGATELIVVCPSSAFVSQFSAPVAFEVVPFGWKRTINQLQKLGPSERRGELLTESGNYLVDVHVDSVYAPDEIEFQAKQVPGVIETGLFLDYADRLVLYNGEIRVLSRLDFASQNDTRPSEELSQMLF